MWTSAYLLSCWTLLLIAMNGLGRAESRCLNNSYFEMTHTSNSVIQKSWFSNCTIGTHFNISHNAIEVLYNESFDILWNVEMIDLSYNQIHEIEDDAFLIMRKLQTIDLSNNDVIELPSGFFNNKPQLRIVDWSYNKIAYIAREVLEYDLPAIEQIIVHHNLLTAFEPWAVFRNNIPMFDVRFNNISTFSNTYNFSYVSMPVYDRKTTDLRNNSIVTWHDFNVMQYKQPNSTTNAVEATIAELMPDMRDNPINCDCNIYNLSKRFKESYFRWSNHEFLDITCHNPPHLRSKLVITELRLSDFICNVTQVCPAGCLCQDQPYYETLNVDCRGAGLTAIPSHVPYSQYKRVSLQLDDNFITDFRNVSYLPDTYSVTISNNTLQSVPEYVMNAIVEKRENARLDFRNNSLTSIPRRAENMKYEHILLSGNKFECTCEMLWMVGWIANAQSFTDQALSCTFEGETFTIIDLDEDKLNCRNIGSIILVVVLSIVCVVVIALLVTAKRCPYETKVLLYKLLGIHPSDKYMVDETTDKEYDMYVCYDDDDIYVRQWVKNKLFKQLEEKKPCYKLCAAIRNTPAGGAAEGRLQLIEQSRRILIILSKDFEKNDMCHYETAQAETLEQNDGRVMYLLYDKCAEEDAKRLEEKMKGRKVFHLHERMLWSKLRYELPSKPLHKQTVVAPNKDMINIGYIE